MGFDSWAVMLGDWELTEDVATFLGATDRAVGLIVGPDRLADGKISVTSRASPFEFDEENPSPGTPALASTPGCRILFGYEPGTNAGYLAGIGGGAGRYILQRYAFPGDTAFQVLATAGEATGQRTDSDDRLVVDLKGGRAGLSVNGTPVLDSALPKVLSGYQLGLWAQGQTTIRFSDFEAKKEAPHLFVVMPFGPPYDDVYTEVIEPVGKDAGFRPIRADDMHGPGVILVDILREIRDSTVIVADISNANPNVYYEVGYAHAAGTPAILLANGGEQLPFDISGFRCIFYDNTFGGKRRVEAALREHLNAITFAHSPLASLP